MEHPDEGTIHAWLDDALPAEEADALERHVRACAECSEAVAEARGFVAAASRIVGALDDVPGGVLPAAVSAAGNAARPGVEGAGTSMGASAVAGTAVNARKRAWWARPQMAAAALVVVVAGSVLVMPRGDDMTARYDASNDSVVSGPSVSPTAAAGAAAAGAAAVGAASATAAAGARSVPPAAVNALSAPAEAVADASARSANAAGEAATDAAAEARGVTAQKVLARALPERASDARREIVMSAPMSAPVAATPPPPTSPKLADAALAPVAQSAARIARSELGCYAPGDSALPRRLELRETVQATLAGRVWFVAQPWPATPGASWRWSPRNPVGVELQALSRGDTTTYRLRTAVRDSLGCR